MLSYEQAILRANWQLRWWVCQKPRGHSAPETGRYDTPPSPNRLATPPHAPAPLLHFLYSTEKGGTLQIFRVLCQSVKITHFLFIWYNNRKAAFSLTWKEQRREEKEVGAGLVGAAGRRAEIHAGKGELEENRQQCHLFTHAPHANKPPLPRHPIPCSLAFDSQARGIKSYPTP